MEVLSLEIGFTDSTIIVYILPYHVATNQPCM
jgi:hypothetical protein